jgi:hypothetical protein
MSNLEPGNTFEGWISYLSNWLVENNIMEEIDQCIVNGYNRNQKLVDTLMEKEEIDLTFLDLE